MRLVGCELKDTNEKIRARKIILEFLNRGFLELNPGNLKNKFKILKFIQLKN
jgi:hypothetical protein